MHKIDLLKGQGIPAKTTTEGLIVLAVTVIVPIIVVAGIIDWHMRTKMAIEMNEREIVKAKEKIAMYASDVKQKEALEKEIDLMNSKLSEVSRSLELFVQWSPILITLSENMPGQMIMRNLTAQSQSVRKTTRRNNDPNKPVTIAVPERRLVMNISGNKSGSYDTIVQNYQERLNTSPELKSRVKEIIPSKETVTDESDQTESYIMNIIFASETK
ncbi:MAG: hypothetical protein JW715_05160 [Sedimentisphaerales bacterium]|nr:hypothetical protein [Sedimentisphaerales bacterium]